MEKLRLRKGKSIALTHSLVTWSLAAGPPSVRTLHSTTLTASSPPTSLFSPLPTTMHSQDPIVSHPDVQGGSPPPRACVLRPPTRGPQPSRGGLALAPPPGAGVRPPSLSSKSPPAHRRPYRPEVKPISSPWAPRGAALPRASPPLPIFSLAHWTETGGDPGSAGAIRWPCPRMWEG